MKFKYLLLSLCMSSVAYAAHVTNRSIYATDITTLNGTTVLALPTTVPVPSSLSFYNANDEINSCSVTTPDAGYSFGNSGYAFGNLQSLLPNGDAMPYPPWIPAHGSIASGYADPNGGTKGALVGFANYQIDGAYNYCDNGFASTPITMSVWAKSSAGGEVLYFGSIQNSCFSFNNSDIDVFCAPFTVTTSWQRYYCSFTPSSSSIGIGVWSKSSSYSVNMYGMQVTSGSALTPYVHFSEPTNNTSISSNSGVSADTAAFTEAYLGGAHIAPSGIITPLKPAQVTGVGCGTANSIYYDTADNYLAYCDNSSSSHQIATTGGGGGGGIAGGGSFSMSGSSGTIYDGSITGSNQVIVQITSCSECGFYSVSCSSGYCNVSSWYNGSGYSNNNYSDYSTLNYTVINP